MPTTEDNLPRNYIEEAYTALESSTGALEFDEPTHTYKHNGQLLTSVTTVLDGVDAWGFRANPVPGWALERGKFVHQMLEYDDEGVLQGYDTNLAGYLESWRAYRAANPTLNMIASEARVFDARMGLAGTLDRLAEDGGVLPILLDIKCGSYRPAVALQTAAYCQMIKVPCRRRTVVVNGDGSIARAHDEPLVNNCTDWKTFVGMFNAYVWKAANRVDMQQGEYEEWNSNL